LLRQGISWGYCRLVLAAFDLTVSMPIVGHLLGRPFAERMGVREGAVESPHMFNAYIEGIRSRLEAQHPRICRMFELAVPILLYADDAALPADSAEDLALSVAIFESSAMNIDCSSPSQKRS